MDGGIRTVNGTDIVLVHTSNMFTAFLNIALSYSPARASASTHLKEIDEAKSEHWIWNTYQSVHRQKVPSSPPTPSSAFLTSYR